MKTHVAHHPTPLALALLLCAPLGCDGGGGGGDGTGRTEFPPAFGGDAGAPISGPYIEGTLTPFLSGSIGGTSALSGAQMDLGGDPISQRPWARTAARALLRRGLATRKNALGVAAPGVPMPGINDPPPPIAPDLPDARADFVPGQTIARLRAADATVIERLHRHPPVSDYRFSLAAWGAADIAALQIERADDPGRPLDHAETVEVIERLAEHPDLRYAHPNHYKVAFSTPNDEALSFQWHYAQIGMPAAWALTTGSNEVVCAVIDDGVNPHPDLDARVIAGYDMVSDLRIAGDGDGRDPQPWQVPESHGAGQSIWHGTHVAGTVGAHTNNQIGVSGVDWACRILPVRVLGKFIPNVGQGTSIDVIAGIYWAAGLEVPGVPPNRNPADVLNLSLGGGPLVQAEQDAVDAAVAAGAAVVVAAGNEDQDATAISMAGYRDVIVVGASELRGRRAPYSNFGGVVDVMAPGGDVSADRNADGYPDGVLSTYLDATGREAGLEFHQGTSMAAPHVAGLIALARALDGDLSPARAEQLLKETADPSGRCDAGCGAGLVNAPAFLRAVGGGGGGGDAAPPQLGLSGLRLDLGLSREGAIRVFNQGGGQLDWSAERAGGASPSLQIRGDARGRLGPGASTSLALAIDPSGLADGTHRGYIDVRGGGVEARVTVIFSVGQAPVTDVGPIAVGLIRLVGDGEQVIVGAEALALPGDGYRYRVPAPAGEWFLIAVADLNGDGDLSDGDLLGIWRDPANIVPIDAQGNVLRGVDFTLLPFGETGAAPTEAPCADLRRCWEACGTDAACYDRCPVAAGCERCYNDTVLPCLQRANCPGGDCVCRDCPGPVDTCFGPRTCDGGATEPTASPVGGYCGAQLPCAAPYQCLDDIPGGYCTRDCGADGQCPAGGQCVAFDSDGDGTADFALCIAACSGPGTCPRPEDSCQQLPDLPAPSCLP